MIRITIEEGQVTERVATALAGLMLALGGAAQPAAAVPPHKQASLTHANWPRFFAEQNAAAQKFLTAVREGGPGPVSIEVVENAIGKSGKEIGGLLGAINRWAPEYGVVVPIQAARGSAGQRTYEWLGLGATPKPPVPIRKRRDRRRSTSTRGDET